MQQGAGSVMRQSGGMRPGLGNFDSERMEDQAMQGAVQQKGLQQQAGNTPTQSQTSGQSAKMQGQLQTPPPPPREVGTVFQELVQRPFGDIEKELATFFDLNVWLGINNAIDTPEEKQKKRVLHQRYQRLTESQRQVAQDKYQKQLRQKQEEERIKQEKKQREEQQKREMMVVPAGKSDKPGLFVGGKGSKQRSQNRLQQQMKTIGTVTDGG